MYRHGDRSPAVFYPTDPYNHTYDWQVGVGELSNTGKTQHYKYGQWIRGRYDEEFLPKRYSNNFIYARSTDYDRTIDSALCNLAGLFPPTDDQIWDKSIHWQPIPVHNVPAADDWILGASLPPCPVYDQALAKVVASPDVQKIINEYHSQIQYVLQNAGFSTNLTSADVLQSVMLIRDSLFIETLYKKP